MREPALWVSGWTRFPKEAGVLGNSEPTVLQTYHPCKESSSILQHWGSNVNQQARPGTESTSHSSLLFSPCHLCVSQTSSVPPLTKQRPLCSSGKDSKHLMGHRGRRVGISCVSSIWIQKPDSPNALIHSCWSSLAHVDIVTFKTQRLSGLKPQLNISLTCSWII